MSGPKPFEGYASRTDAILAFRAEGLSTKAIARRVGIDPSAVSALECSARRRGTPANGPRRPVDVLHDPVLRLLPDDILSSLRREAARRSLSLGQLVARLLTTVASDHLFTAILDDAGASA